MLQFFIPSPLYVYVSKQIINSPYGFVWIDKTQTEWSGMEWYEIMFHCLDSQNMNGMEWDMMEYIPFKQE